MNLQAINKICENLRDNIFSHRKLFTFAALRLCGQLFSSIALYIILFSAFGCHNKDFTPKKRGYFRIDLPQKAYQKYDSDCPFTFEYPVYAKMENETGPHTEPCWVNMQFPTFNGTLHLSYKPIKGNLEQFTEDVRVLVNKHIVKSSGIPETPFSFPGKVYGVKYDIEGNAASAVQFYITDSVKHFMRGAFYMNVAPQIDSLAPVIQFLEKDIDHMIETFQWK